MNEQKANLAEIALRAYKRFISPALPASCRFVPTCSEYAAEAVAVHGIVRGSLMALWRLLRCHPFGQGGYDPVPVQGYEAKDDQGEHARALARAVVRGRSRREPLRSPYNKRGKLKTA